MTNTARNDVASEATEQMLPIGSAVKTISALDNALSSGAAQPPLDKESSLPSASDRRPVDTVLPSAFAAAFARSAEIENFASAQIEADHVTSRTRVDLAADGIHAAAVELKDLKAEMMSVVLRPDTHTEIHLHLSVQRDVVEVTAQFARGDWGLFDTEWARLQKTLAEQGIRLNALQLDPDFGTGSGQLLSGGFDQHEHLNHEMFEAAHAVDVVAPRTPVTGQAKAGTPTAVEPRYWESWA